MDMTSDTWVCVGGGPSLTVEDLNYCRDQGWKLATCNMTFRLIPDARCYLANDTRVWRTYGEEIKATLSKDCELWCGSHWAEHTFGLRRLVNDPEGAWPSLPGHSCPGALSGFKLLHLVGVREHKPARIILLGYDHQHTGDKAHHHEDYPRGWSNATRLDFHTHRFNALAAEADVPILNASRETALECFERVALSDL